MRWKGNQFVLCLLLYFVGNLMVIFDFLKNFHKMLKAREFMNYYYNDYSNPQKNLIESCCQLIKYIREANM